MSERQTGRGDILIVDDTLPNLRLLVAMLTEQGYKVRGVPSGPMALTAASTNPDAPTLAAYLRGPAARARFEAPS